MNAPSAQLHPRPMVTATSNQLEFIEGLVHKMNENLALLVDREIDVTKVTAETVDTRPAGPGQVHVSFKLGFTIDGAESHGCALMPLPEAIALSCYLMMMPDSAAESQRGDSELDAATKDALLELSNFVGGAADEVVRSYFSGSSARSEGCQGVRADVRPALDYREGDPLIVGRVTMSVHTYPPFELIIILPALPDLT